MQLVKKTKLQLVEQTERNKGVAYDKLVNKFSNAAIREKYGELSDSRIWAITRRWEVVRKQSDLSPTA